ncbi:hypothetical protein ACLOJK_018407 [Asimina triloba]
MDVSLIMESKELKLSELCSNHDGAESTMSSDKYADACGATFDTMMTLTQYGVLCQLLVRTLNMRGMDKTTPLDLLLQRELGLNPIRTDSPSATDSFFHKSGQSYSFASWRVGIESE